MMVNSTEVTSYSMKPLFYKTIEQADEKNSHESEFVVKFWENLAYIALFGTILGQVLVGGLYLAAQGVWLGANIVMAVRDFVLHRPLSEKVKDIGLCMLTITLITLRLIGIY